MTIESYLSTTFPLPDSTEQQPGILLSPFQQKLLCKNLNEDLRPEYLRRIKIMLLADSGHSQSEICRMLNCSHETARYWILIAKTGQAHRWKELSIGRPKRINEEYLRRLKELVNQSPRECGYAFSRWTAQWLSKHLKKELGIEISDRHVNRLLKKMKLSTCSKRSQADDSTDNKVNERIRIAIKELSHTSVPQSSNFSLFPISQESE